MRPVFALLLSLLWLPADAAVEPDGGPKLFEAASPVHIRVDGNFTALRKDDGETRGWHDARLVHDGREYEVRLRVRGNFRRKACRLPPLTLDFRNTKRGVLSGTVFAGQNRLKLVRPCAGGNRSEVDIREEYLAYRIFNTLTDESFRVRMLVVDWHDLPRGLSQTTAAFLIESAAGLATRLGMDRRQAPVRPALLDPGHATLAAVFQFLIGNTDFLLAGRLKGRECCHNARVFEAGGRVISVPYDFDFAGLVNAPYAGANPVVEQTNVRVRKYLGFCVEPEILAGTVARIESVAAAWPALSHEAGLDERQARRARRYLEPVLQGGTGLAARLEQACIAPGDA